MKFLVTGCAGFIGSNLVEYLLDKDHKVVGLDNFATGKEVNLKTINNHPDFQFFKGDIRNYEDCVKASDGVDVVLHQAALGSVPRSIKDPMTSTDVNIGGFIKMMHASKENGVKRFVYAASSSTYGDHPGLPKVEDKIGKPLSPYAITKYANELFAENFKAVYGLDTIGLRYFNVFGRRQDPNGAYAAVIPLFVKELMNHKSPTINGDGTHSRDFTYIDNVLQINYLAATTENAEALNQVYNVACGENNNLNQLIAYLKKYLSDFDEEIAQLKVLHGPEREGDVKHSLADISRAKNLLGYNPTDFFEDGIQKAVKWYWENLRD